jgi:tetratricopeptide (TPR) repeat protein
LTNLGGVHHSRREFSQALKCQVEAEQIAREIGDRRILWYAVRGQAATFDETQDFHAGMERNLLACRIADAAGLAEQAHEARVWAACDYLNLHQPEEALELLAGALGYNAHSATGMRYASMGCSVLACSNARRLSRPR